jgi:AhpD family alkylhydroperoxidase
MENASEAVASEAFSIYARPHIPASRVVISSGGASGARNEGEDVSHVNIGKTYAGPYKAMLEFNDQAVAAGVDAGLSPLLVELVKVRASQINGCAFCLRMHCSDAIAAGETADRLAVVAGWWESQYFSPEEQAALQIAERVTMIGDHGRLVDRGVDVDGILTEKQIAAVTWLAVVINSWNRIAISSHYPVHP